MPTSPQSDFYVLARILARLTDGQRTIDQMRTSRLLETVCVLGLLLPSGVLIGWFLSKGVIPLSAVGLLALSALPMLVTYASLLRDYRMMRNWQRIHLTYALNELNRVLPDVPDSASWTTFQRLELRLRLAGLGIELKSLPEGNNLRVLFS